MLRKLTGPVALAVLASTALPTLPAAQPAGLDELSLPARLRATMKLVHARVLSDREKRATDEVMRNLGVRPPPSDGRTAEAQGGVLTRDSAFVSIVIRRWSSEEELGEFEQTLIVGGGSALVKQMEKKAVGDLQFDTELRWPVVYAKTWMTPVGQQVQIAVVGRLLAWDAGGLPDGSAVINIVDLSLPRGQPSGTGSLVSAGKVAFEESGRMVAVVEVMGSMTQSLNNVEREPARH